MKTKIFFIASFIAIVLFISCDNSDNTADNMNPTSPTSQVAVDNKIDASIEDVSNIAEDQFSMKQSSTAKSSETVKSFLPACAVTTWTYVDGTFTGTIDFGTEGCTLENGNVLKGKITLSFSGNFMTPEQTITYSFDQFYHNGNKIQGSKTIIRTLKSTELLAAVHPVFTCTIDMTITFEDGSVYTRTGNRTKEMVEGYDTKGNWSDNVFLVTGSETTTWPNGDTSSSTIQTPLRYEMACKKPFPVSGTVSKVKNGVETLVDYGTGECDNLASVTVNGVTTTIELKK
ncbi:hypothetical protein DOS84_09570 [Flavobacterium aquariorum]|uniref:Lipocalin-like domain-containing protein n=1 Tax=Flavobacterium aquariorum TaxID=2217670 RepID=A0A2W7U8K2_9FLAO|nr:hypothetical protein [Flavobacterium aquariorum]PZX93649.1 hypothetical protein DOS84_09570 [Flavobacterium aquariorum]